MPPTLNQCSLQTMRVRQPSRPITFATFGRPIVSEFNLWVGVNKAGYSVGEELPIMLLLFLLPAALAVLIRWKFA